MELDPKLIGETNAYRCLECAKCSGVCPVARYSDTFSPRLLLIKSLRNTHPDAFSSEELWQCLNCMACDEVCPSAIKYSDLTQILKQTAGIEKMEGTCSHGGVLQSISRMMMSTDMKQNRLDWLTKEYKTSNDSEYLYFTGCLPYFDALFTDIGVESVNIARSTMRILNYFNIKPQVMSNEKCCGHDFYWNGDYKTFEKLAEANIEMIRQNGAKKIITACPECYRTLKVDYGKLFGNLPYEIEHITEFLSRKLKEENLNIPSQSMKLTYQDPCRLSRHLGIFDAPRNCFSHLLDSEYHEMAHHHHRAICCGVSGWINCSAVSKQIQIERLFEAQATGADTLVTACPKCQIHFSCAKNGQESELIQDIKIKDITEVFAENLH